MDEENKKFSLRPDEQVQKILLSTPSDFSGSFETDDILISHAWPPIYTGRSHWFKGNADALSRTAIILAFRTPPPVPSAPGVAVPNYEHAGDFFASILSVLFGKRFDVHGPLEMAGYYHVPDLQALNAPSNRRLRHNDSRPRHDYPIPLDLAEVSRMGVLVESSDDEPRIAAFHSAAKLYRRALTTIEVDAEIAYLNLITAGEIVSNSHHISENDALDVETRALLLRVESEMEDGPQIAASLRRRLRGIKQRFVTVISSLIDESFFDSTEATESFGAFQKDDFRSRIGAAYDLRSRFVHSGYPFGRWTSLHMPNFEIPMGKPVLPDKDMAKVLSKAPLFNGLERVIRHVLLKFASELGAVVQPRPSGEPAPDQV